MINYMIHFYNIYTKFFIIQICHPIEVLYLSDIFIVFIAAYKLNFDR